MAWYNNTELPTTFEGFDLTEIVANKAARVTWGNGFILSSEKEDVKKVIQEIQQTIPLQSIFYENEKILSSIGYSIIEIVQMDGGQIGWSIVQPFGISRVAKFLDTPEMAVVWSRLKYDDFSGYIKTTYTREKISRQFYNEKEVSLDGEQVKLAKRFQIKSEEKNKIGVVPVQFFQNLPKKNFFGGYLSDYYPDSVAVKGLQALLNKAKESLEHELYWNRTRLAGIRTQTEIQQALKNNYETDKPNENDFWINGQVGMAGESDTQLIQGDPKLDKYTQLFDWIKNSFIEGSNYSGSDDTTNQKTEAEVLFTKSNDAEITRVKRNLRQTQYRRLFKIMFLMKGLDVKDEDFVFEIKENTVMDRLKQIEVARQAVDSGLSTRLREIKNLHGVSLEEAQKILEEIDKEQAEFQEKEMAQMEQMGQINANQEQTEQKQTAKESNNKDLV